MHFDEIPGAVAVHVPILHGDQVFPSPPHALLYASASGSDAFTVGLVQPPATDAEKRRLATRPEVGAGSKCRPGVPARRSSA